MCRIAQRIHNYNKSVLVPNGGRGIWESGDLARRNPPGDDSLVQRLIRSVGTTRIYNNCSDSSTRNAKCPGRIEYVRVLTAVVLKFT